MQNKQDISNIRALIVDMDGVLWRGDTALPGLAKFFDLLYQSPIPFITATNNASRTVAQYEQKFKRLGITIDPKNILTSSLATATYLKGELEAGAAVYVIGQDGIRQAVKEAGFTMIDNIEQPAQAVIVGIDNQVNYEKLKQASLHIRRGARFIGTNGDMTFPAEEGYYPGTGAILAAIEAATEVKPITIGKPEPLMFQIAVQKMGSHPDQTAIVGDRLETDILGGQRAGVKTILVTTGVDNLDTIPVKGIRPDLIFSGIDELTEVWQSQRGRG